MSSLSNVGWSWWAIPGLLTVAVIIVSVVAYSYADCRYIYQLEMDRYASGASQAVRPPNPISPLPITMAIRGVGRVVSAGVAWLAWSGILYLALILFGRNGVGFSSVWTLIQWSWLPYAVRGILQSAFMTLTGRPVYNQGLSGLVVDRTPPPMMSYNYVIPSVNEEALASVLSRLDVYLVWQLALMVMGTLALSRFSRRKAIAVVVGLWLVFTLVSVVPTFLPGTFARFRYF
jgi:hypothetical protein